MGQLVGVPPGDGVVEQELQRLVVGEALQSRLAKAVAHLLPVAVVDAHADPSFSLLRILHGNVVLYHAPTAITSTFPPETLPEGAGAIGFPEENAENPGVSGGKWRPGGEKA